MSRWIYLASASPRRRQLLDQLGLRHEQIVAEVDESRYPGETPPAYAARLAQAKARAGHALLADAAAPLLAADTVVALGDEIFHKATSAAEAELILAALSGQTHQVMTAVTLLAGGHQYHALSISSARFRALSTAEIRAYAATGEPLGKAGAYAIQGLAAAFIERLEGSYSGVMGLPLYETAGLLAQAGIRILE
jgi:septum formation protein